jgi:hypothetical protein
MKKLDNIYKRLDNLSRTYYIIFCILLLVGEFILCQAIIRYVSCKLVTSDGTPHDKNQGICYSDYEFFRY